MEIRCSRKHHMPKAAVAAIVALIALCGSVGVYAARNYLAERMATVSETEQQEYIEEVSEAEVHADSFSREFTENEDMRMQELAEAYQTEGKFPEGEIVRIASEDEILPDRVCFLPDTSTFYLPETEMTDEDLLEIIDFYCKRDYSIMEQEREDIEYSVDYEMDHDVALEKAEELIARVFEIDLNTCEVSTEYNSATYHEELISELYVDIKTEENINYRAIVNLQTEDISQIMIQYEEQSYADSIFVDMDSFDMMIIDKAKKIAVSYDNRLLNATMSLQYIINADDDLDHGVCSIIAEADDCVAILSYSYHTANFYEIRFTDNKEYYENWKQDMKGKYEELGMTFHEVYFE